MVYLHFAGFGQRVAITVGTSHTPHRDAGNVTVYTKSTAKLE